MNLLFSITADVTITSFYWIRGEITKSDRRVRSVRVGECDGGESRNLLVTYFLPRKRRPDNFICRPDGIHWFTIECVRAIVLFDSREIFPVEGVPADVAETMRVGVA
jgi:hypothetical protein